MAAWTDMEFRLVTPDTRAQPGEPSPAESSGPRELLRYRPFGPVDVAVPGAQHSGFLTSAASVHPSTGRTSAGLIAAGSVAPVDDGQNRDDCAACRDPHHVTQTPTAR